MVKLVMTNFLVKLVMILYKEQMGGLVNMTISMEEVEAISLYWVMPLGLVTMTEIVQPAVTMTMPILLSLTPMEGMLFNCKEQAVITF